MSHSTTFVVAAGLLWAAAGCVPAVKTASNGEPAMGARGRRELAESVCSGWSDKSRLAARVLISRYGAPDVVGSSRLIWHGNGPWKRTIVRDVPRPYAGAADEDLGVVEQTVSYVVNRRKSEALSRFSRRLSFDLARMEMTSRADREEVNFLLLNLANDVNGGAMTVPDARYAYARILELEAAGKTTPYLLDLRFGPERPRTP
jgi:hypothetical protein